MTQGNDGTMTHDILNFSLRLLLVCSLAAAGLGITPMGPPRTISPRWN